MDNISYEQIRSLVKSMKALEIPAHLHSGLALYTLHGTPTGSFLEAMIAGDLFDACGRADEESATAIFPLAKWIYSNIPASGMGSRENYNDWIRRKREEREERGETVSPAEKGKL